MQLTAKDPRWRPDRADEVAWRASQLRDDLTACVPATPEPPPAVLPHTPTLSVIPAVPPAVIPAVIPAAPLAVIPGLTPPGRLRPRRRAALVSACIVLAAFAVLGLATVIGFGPAARHTAVVPSAAPSPSSRLSATPLGRSAPSGQPATGPRQQSGTQQPVADRATPGRDGKGRKHGHQNGQGSDDT
jgi:hypothetical protein